MSKKKIVTIRDSEKISTNYLKGVIKGAGFDYAYIVSQLNKRGVELSQNAFTVKLNRNNISFAVALLIVDICNGKSIPVNF